METLVCTQCKQEWERARTRGRKPKVCPDCKGGNPPKRTPDTTSTPRMEAKATTPGVDTLPPASRTSGWCTDYDPAPQAQHDRCDGDLGKWRCPCECHGVD